MAGRPTTHPRDADHLQLLRMATPQQILCASRAGATAEQCWAILRQWLCDQHDEQEKTA